MQSHIRQGSDSQKGSDNQLNQSLGDIKFDYEKFLVPISPKTLNGDQFKNIIANSKPLKTHTEVQSAYNSNVKSDADRSSKMREKLPSNKSRLEEQSPLQNSHKKSQPYVQAKQYGSGLTDPKRPFVTTRKSDSNIGLNLSANEGQKALEKNNSKEALMLPQIKNTILQQSKDPQCILSKKTTLVQSQSNPVYAPQSPYLGQKQKFIDAKAQIQYHKKQNSQVRNLITNLKPNDIGTIYEESTLQNENLTQSKVNKTFENEVKDKNLDTSQTTDFDNKLIFQTMTKLNGEAERNILTDIKGFQVLSSRDSQNKVDVKLINYRDGIIIPKQGSKKKEMLNRDKKKIKMQQKKEQEIKEYFKSHIHQSLHKQFTNTEFSTPGASSKYLEEYEIGDENFLGSGGYAEVRLATHIPTNHQVAIKIYEKYKLIDPSVKANILKEIKILWKLKHQNIMTLYESIDSLKNVYLVTEYVKGLSLHEYLREQTDSKLDEFEANKVLKQLLSAIQYMQKQGLCHRDIKLENIVINKTTKQIKLIDFGFATQTNKTQKLYCGTQYYMSPEIVAKKEYRGGPVDMWCCGVVYYAMVTGHFPFSAHTDRELIRRVQKGIYHVPKELNKDQVRIIARMLDTDPSQRAKPDEILNDSYLRNQMNQDPLGQQNLDSARSRESQYRYENYLSMQRKNYGSRFNQQLDMISVIDEDPFSQINQSNINDQSLFEPKVELFIDEETVQNIVKLGYQEEEVRTKVKNEKDLLGQLYRRLLSLKQQK